MSNKITKFVSATLAMLLILANSMTLISYAADTLMSENALENQTKSTNVANVEFDVAYDNGKHTKTLDANQTGVLNVQINVKNGGYVKDAQVSFNGANFKIKDDETNPEVVESIDETKNEIKFNQINSGNSISKTLIMQMNDTNINTDVANKDNEISLTAIYVNKDGKETDVNGKVKLNTAWKLDTAELELSHEMTKYAYYQNKLIVQSKVKSNIKENVVPVKDENITVTLPAIDGVNPSYVSVIANSTSATNGNTTKPEWSFDKEQNKVTVKTKNENVAWIKNAQDEFLVTYVYELTNEQVANLKSSEVKISYNVENDVTTYTANNLELKNSVKGTENLSEELGTIADYETNVTTTLNKGYLYNNINTADENKRDTEYTVNYKAVIPVKTLAENVIFEEAGTNLENETSEVSYDKTIKIAQSEFTEILGEVGTIEIQNENGEALITLTKDSPVTDGYFVIDLANANVKNVKIVTSKPQTEGILNVTVNKAIMKNLSYSKSDLEKVSSLEVNTKLSVKTESENVLIAQVKNTIALEEPTQKVNIETNRDTLSTILKNEGVEIKVTLENDSIDDTMFSSPRVQVKLPSNIKDASVKADLYYDDELSLQSANLVNNSDGTKSIDLQLAGSQTKYNNVAAKGATVVITADITLEELTPTTQNQIIATVTNSDGNVTEATSDIKYLAPTGVVATNGVTYTNNDQVSIMSLSGDEKTGLIPTASESQEVAFNMNVINNYGNTISNVVVLGRIPAQGNGLNTNLDLTMSKPIIVSGIDGAKVYYSSNVSATTDLNSSANAWTSDEGTITNAKSYMIVLPNTDIEQGKGFKFGYSAIVPGELDYDKYAYENYSVYYTNNQADGAISELAQAATTGLTTGTGPKFETTFTANSDATTAKSGSILKYTLKVTNAGTEQANDVKVKFPILKTVTYVVEGTNGLEYTTPEDASYTDDETDTAKRTVEISLGNIAANSTLEKAIWFKTTASDIEEVTFTTEATVYNEKATATSNAVANVTLTKTYFSGKLLGTDVELRSGDETTLIMNVKSAKEYSVSGTFTKNEETGEMEYVETPYDGNRENTVITLTLPSELEIVSVTKGNMREDITSSVTKNNNEAKINVGTLNYETTKVEVTVRCQINENNVYSKKLDVTAKIKADNTPEEDLGTTTLSVNKPGLSISQTSTVPSSVEIGTTEKFKYTFTVKNLSNISIANIEFTDKISQGLVYSYTEVTLADGSKTTYTEKAEDGTIKAKVLILGAGKTATIEVNVVADIVNQTTTVKNKGTIKQSEVGTIDSNEVTNKIKEYKPGEIIDDDNNNGGNTSNKTGRIAGVVWMDENKDGIKDASETKVSGVKVLLLNNKTGNIARNANNEEGVTTTDSDGAYAFSNMYEGNYTVIFLYDSKNYSPTDYQKESVDSTMNSDAMDKTVVYEGQTVTAAVTEEIKLTENNRYDIDLGLVENKKFDLKLDKTVTNITVTDSRGTTVHEYNKNFAKIDFKDKYISSSTIVVEYKLVVTNEGAVPGYVKKIADYLPSELNFSSELNTDWYASTDGKTVYNNALANKVLNPGESAEVKLVLTKKMTANGIGLTITNNAEIYETSNDYGLEDYDSTPGNKDQNEDDYSSANVLTSVQTGQPVMYVTLGIAVVTIIIAGAYLIKMKVIK